MRDSIEVRTPEAQIEYSGKTERIDRVLTDAADFSHREIADASGLSIREIGNIMRGAAAPSSRTVAVIESAVGALRKNRAERAESDLRLIAAANEFAGENAMCSLARDLGVDPDNFRKMLNGKRHLTVRIRACIQKLVARLRIDPH